MQILFNIPLLETNFTQYLELFLQSVNQNKMIHFEHLEFIRCNVDYLDSMKIELRRLDRDLIEFNDDRRVVLNIVVKNPI